MGDKINKFFNDKRIAFAYVLVIVVLLSGVTYALTYDTVGLNIATAVIGIDEDNYGNTSFDSSDIVFMPVLDSDVNNYINSGEDEDILENIIKIDFSVRGASTNNNDNIIYDIALVDFMMDCDLLIENMKWKLIKNGVDITPEDASFSYKFDTIKNGRYVLTDTQQDLKGHNESLDEYTFYMWLSDSCQSESIANCDASMDQTYLLEKWFTGKIEVELYTGTKKELVRDTNSNRTAPVSGSCISDYAPYASSYIKRLYNDGSSITTVNIGGDSSKPEVHLNATQGIMLDNNGIYRYYGANPNNYVEYNDELWRIISVENVKSSKNDTEGETRVKIVKADILKDDNGLDKYSWDSSASTINSGNGVNDWSKADLMTELNTLYFNSTSGNCYTGSDNATTACNFANTGLSEEARNLTGDALYYLGGSEASSGLYANDHYIAERGTAVYDCNVNDGACPRAKKWLGRIGIMYLSDYLYATDLSLCTSGGSNYGLENCKNNNWLFLPNRTTEELIIVPRASASFLVFYVYLGGGVNHYAMSSNSYIVRPVQYLKKNVLIVSGEGTSEKPYKLKKNSVDNNGSSSYKLLSEVEDGSYVEYVGNNGCLGDACSGVNANSSSTSNGWCNNSSYEFKSNGWRVAYTKDGSAHLISGGAPECLTNSIYSISELNNMSSSYCNSTYVEGGICLIGTNVWAMNGNDFYEITGYQITDSSCFGSSSASNCNISSDLISNGSSYLFAEEMSETSLYTIDLGFYLSGTYGYSANYGWRPVIKLDPSVYVVDGTGTYEDPYIIGKQ